MHDIFPVNCSGLGLHGSLAGTRNTSAAGRRHLCGKLRVRFAAHAFRQTGLLRRPVGWSHVSRPLSVVWPGGRPWAPGQWLYKGRGMTNGRSRRVQCRRIQLTSFATQCVFQISKSIQTSFQFAQQTFPSRWRGRLSALRLGLFVQVSRIWFSKGKRPCPLWWWRHPRMLT